MYGGSRSRMSDATRVIIRGPPAAPRARRGGVDEAEERDEVVLILVTRVGLMDERGRLLGATKLAG